jgi:hypothetical protein
VARRSPFAVVGLGLRWLAPLAGALAGCGAPDPAAGTATGLRFDPCAEVILVADEDLPGSAMAGVAAGLDSWNKVAGAHLAVVRRSAASSAGAVPTVPIHFQAAGAPFHGLYDPERGEIFINTDLAGHGEAVAVAHEVGHAFGLVHVSTDERRSVMNPNNLEEEPNAGDVATLAAGWGGSCPSDGQTPAPADVVAP